MISKSALPAFRAMVSKRLTEDYDLTQQEVAGRLGVTQASISNYARKARGVMLNLEVDPNLAKAADQVAEVLSSESRTSREALRMMTEVCDYIRFNHAVRAPRGPRTRASAPRVAPRAWGAPDSRHDKAHGRPLKLKAPPGKGSAASRYGKKARVADGLAPTASRRGRELRQAEGALREARPPHRLRGGSLPERRRVLGQRDGDPHAHGGHVLPGVQVLHGHTRAGRGPRWTRSSLTTWPSPSPRWTSTTWS